MKTIIWSPHGDQILGTIILYDYFVQQQQQHTKNKKEGAKNEREDVCILYGEAIETKTPRPATIKPHYHKKTRIENLYANHKHKCTQMLSMIRTRPSVTARRKSSSACRSLSLTLPSCRHNAARDMTAQIRKLSFPTSSVSAFPYTRSFALSPSDSLSVT